MDAHVVVVHNPGDASGDIVRLAARVQVETHFHPRALRERARNLYEQPVQAHVQGLAFELPVLAPQVDLASDCYAPEAAPLALDGAVRGADNAQQMSSINWLVEEKVGACLVSAGQQRRVRVAGDYDDGRALVDADVRNWRTSSIPSSGG